MTKITKQFTLQHIVSIYHSLSEKEKRVADYVSKNPEKIIHLSINQLADELSVAEATIFRFCKRIGFKGYQAMKIALASEVVSSIKNIHETISESDTEIEVSEKVFNSNIRAIEDTLHILHHENFKKAVQLLVDTDRIEFYGNGGSAIIALDAHHKFMRTGITTVSYTDSHLQLMSASQLSKDDVAIIISHSGSNKDILEVVEVAKNSGAYTIGITNYAKSPFSSLVDIPLFTVAQETEFRSEALASRIAELSIIDALYVSVSILQREKMKDTIQNMRKAISVKRM
ncbi:MurR/RpiR family transcriptional regulator [Bacillaceae bacterium S4-13-58]